MKSLGRWGRGGGLQVAALFTVLTTYLLTSSPDLLGGDAGELSAGGILHPPGYPLFTILQRALRWLPAASPAHRTALVTAVVASASVAALAWAARAWGASRASAMFAALLYAAGPLAWDLATHAEVFTLNVLLAMAIVGLSAEAPPRASEPLRALLLALLAGLGLANHHSIVLVAPLGLFAFVRAISRSRRRAAAVARSLGALLLGLSPYAYLLLAARRTPLRAGCVWGDPRTIRGLLDHFLRAEYGTTQLGISDAPLEPLEHVLLLAEQLVTDLPGSLLVLVMAAVVALRQGKRPKLPLLLLIASFLLAGPLFVACFNLPARGTALLVTERFHLLPLALAAILLALAIDACARALAAERGAPSSALTRVILGAGAAVVFARAALSYPDLRERQRPTVDLWLRNVMALLPPDSIVLHTGDHRVSAFLYARCALRERPDVTAIAPRLLLTDWYPPQVSAQLGFEVVHGQRRPGTGAPSLASGALVEQLLATGRPVFVTDLFAPAVAKLPSYPLGPLVRIVRRPDELPSVASLVTTNEAAFASMQLEPTLPARHTWAAITISDYARAWTMLAPALEASGDTEGAARCASRAAALTPP
ncbi:MAG: hypothetical protein JWP97_1732 [Labilithrix sp.]|nr:hypothetical protein [Labilithrix sp.]